MTTNSEELLTRRHWNLVHLVVIEVAKIMSTTIEDIVSLTTKVSNILNGNSVGYTRVLVTAVATALGNLVINNVALDLD